MKYHHGYSVCVSTQVGCKMGCKFCASTGLNFARNLSSGEIVEQVLAIERDQKIKVSNTYNLTQGEHTVIVEFKNNLESTEEMFRDCSNLKEVFFIKFKTKTNLEQIAKKFGLHYFYSYLCTRNQEVASASEGCGSA